MKSNGHKLAICLLAARLEDNRIPYTDILSKCLIRHETELVQKYVNDHVNYPAIENWQGSKKQ